MKPLNIPTMLTLGRIAVIPLICLAYWLPWHHAQALAAALFALASFTDWLDGYLARYWGQATALGAFLDPVADKILVSSVLVMIAASQHTLWIALPSAVIIGREIVISALREWMAEVGQRTSVAVSQIGRVKTSFQMLAIFLLLWYGRPFAAYGMSFHAALLYLGVGLLYVAAVLTLWSMVFYLKVAYSGLTSDIKSQ